MKQDLACSCEKCINSCWHNPGWFGSKEEIIGAAKILNLTLYEFTQKYLVKEYWVGDETDNIYIPVPIRNVNRISPEKQAQLLEMDKLHLYTNQRDIYRDEINACSNFDVAPWGYNLIHGFACIFLDENNRCKIHESKPSECRDSYGCKSTVKKDNRRNYVKYWKGHQGWIKDNLETPQ